MARQPLSVSQAKANLRLAACELDIAKRDVMRTLRSSPAALAGGAFALGLAMGIPKLRRIVLRVALGKCRRCRSEEPVRSASKEQAPAGRQ